MKEDIEGFRTYLFTVAYNILGEVEEAEDLVQESFVYFISLRKIMFRIQNPTLSG